MIHVCLLTNSMFLFSQCIFVASQYMYDKSFNVIVRFATLSIQSIRCGLNILLLDIKFVILNLKSKHLEIILAFICNIS